MPILGDHTQNLGTKFKHCCEIWMVGQSEYNLRIMRTGGGGGLQHL